MSLEDEALAPIRDACAAVDGVALAGAPVEGADGALHIATLRADAAGIAVAYRKAHLGGDEPARFSPGTGPAALDLDGRRVGLGICKDTGVDRHLADTAALGIDLYVAGLVHLPEELAEHEERAARIARACGAYVAFASFAGPTGGGYLKTAGCSSVWAPDGTPIARAGVEPGALARASLPPAG